jgi:hypothetical protein
VVDIVVDIICPVEGTSPLGIAQRVDASAFRFDFPEFTDTTKYPDSAVNYWLSFAPVMLNQHRWGPPSLVGQPPTLYDFGVEMFVAHNLVLELQAQQRANLGGPPGVQTGVMTAVSANGASVSYDPNVGINPDDGQWNLTTYGMRLIQMIKLVGAGPVQYGMGRVPIGEFVGPAWPGPFPFPGWFG